MERSYKWLYPGIRIKRWVLVCVSGIAVIMLGTAAFFLPGIIWFRVLTGLLLLFFGTTILYIGVRKIVRSFMKSLAPQHEAKVMDILYQKAHLERGPDIAVIGGGTGLSVLLGGLKKYTSNLTAIVTVADDGGSSGRLRQQFDVPPPGDIRECLVALADAEPLMRRLFQFRFAEGREFKGHSFGNLFITAMSKLTGDFEEAIKESSKVLAIKGKVIPCTAEKVRLIAEYQDGSRKVGESKIPQSEQTIKQVYLSPLQSEATPDVLEALHNAEVIILGPGSLFTSIIPNLLVKGVSRALLEARALKIYVCNIMTQKGETDNYTASLHIEALVNHAKSKVFDYCLFNTGELSEQLLVKYRQEDSYPVAVDVERIKEMGFIPVGKDLVTREEFLRHDADKLAKAIIELIVAQPSEQ